METRSMRRRRLQFESAKPADEEIQTVCIPIDLENIQPVDLVDEDAVGVPEEGCSSLSPNAIPLWLPRSFPMSQVTSATLAKVNPCKPQHKPPPNRPIKHHSTVKKKSRPKPYDRPPQRAASTPKRSRAQLRNERRNHNTLQAEKQEKKLAGVSGYKVAAKTSIKFSSPESITLDSVDTSTDLKASKGAYQSKSNKTVTDTIILTVEECRRRNYLEIEWDGQLTIVLVDNQHRILAVLVGKPDDSTWEDVIKGAIGAMRDALAKLKFPCGNCGDKPHDAKCKDCKKARGSYQSLSVGLSLGSGSTAPGMLKQEQCNIDVLKELILNEHIQRLAGIASSDLAFYFPKLYRELVQKLDQLYHRDSSFQRLFESIFPGATFNFGPQTVTLPHFDSKNKGNGVVSLCSLGDFDHRKGGHLVLITLKLFVQFPSGSTVLFPSAIIEHANTPIQPHENRMSFTQWMAGGLFRWVDYGFQLKKECQLRNPTLYRELENTRNSSWKKAVQVFSKYHELQKDHKEVYGLEELDV